MLGCLKTFLLLFRCSLVVSIDNAVFILGMSALRRTRCNLSVGRIILFRIKS